MLCAPCSAIFETADIKFWEPLDKTHFDEYSADQIAEHERAALITHHERIQDMAAAVLNGCPICSVIWRHFFLDANPADCLSVPVFWRDGNPHSYFHSGTHCRLRKQETSDNESGFTLQVALNSPMDRRPNEYRRLCFSSIKEPSQAESNKPLPWPKADPVKNWLGNATLQTVKNWMRNCQSTHVMCNQVGQSSKWYPTRLIEMKQNIPKDPHKQFMLKMAAQMQGTKPEPRMRLIDTDEIPPDGQYVTLTHRWSDPDMFKTKRRNIDDMKKTIRKKDLPSVLHDAIIFAYNLGYNYIWIDSLCIIQDDDSDWAREAMSMAEIYTRAALNLSATSGQESIFPQRQKSLLTPLAVTPKWKGFEDQSYKMHDPQFWEDRIVKSPCNTRAWITQERMLSPRVLHFTYDQLLWECHELEAAESFPYGLPREMTMRACSGFKQKPTSSTLSKRLSEVDLPYQEQYLEWATIVNNYAPCEITRESDRLIAIAGLAKKHQAAYNDEWLAGMWKRTLPGELIWLVHKAQRSNKPPPPPDLTQLVGGFGTGGNHTSQIPRSSRLSSYQAPSWSWASVLGDVEPGSCLVQGSPDSMINILDVKITLTDPSNPFGHVKDAVLCLSGTIYPLTSHPPMDEWEMKGNILTRSPPMYYIAGLPLVETKPSWSTYDISILWPSHIVHSSIDEPTHYATLAKTVFLPVLRRNVEHREDGKDKVTKLVAGLCLLAVEGGKQGVYRRIGRIDMFGEEAQMFEDGWEAQKMRDGGEHGWEERAFSTTLNESLYIDGKVGVIEII